MTWGLVVLCLWDFRQVDCLFGIDYFICMKLWDNPRFLENSVCKTSVQININVYIFKRNYYLHYGT